MNSAASIGSLAAAMLAVAGETVPPSLCTTTDAISHV